MIARLSTCYNRVWEREPKEIAKARQDDTDSALDDSSASLSTNPATFVNALKPCLCLKQIARRRYPRYGCGSIAGGVTIVTCELLWSSRHVLNSAAGKEAVAASQRLHWADQM